MSSGCSFLRQGACRYKKKSRTVPKMDENAIANESTIDDDSIIEESTIEEQCEDLADHIHELQITTTSSLTSNEKTGELKFEVEDYDVLDVVKEIQTAEEKLNRIRQRVGMKFPGVYPFLKTDEIDIDFRCGICLDVFIRPVLLGCSHSFCEWCIESWSKRSNSCPTCRVRTDHKSYCLGMDNIIKSAVEKGPAKYRREYESRVEQRRKEGILGFEFNEDLYVRYVMERRSRLYA